jgi:hypothetical protein
MCVVRNTLNGCNVTVQKKLSVHVHYQRLTERKDARFYTVTLVITLALCSLLELQYTLKYTHCGAHCVQMQQSW